jgi:4-amino-4-deoxy-L-arabinose transferase-like glycosyltransferase
MKAGARDAIALAALVSLGIVLRVPYLLSGLWRDEASTYYDVVPNSVAGVLDAVVRGELNPPGFFLLERFWTYAVGSSDLMLKFPAFVFGVMLIPATYLLGRAVASRPVGLVAAGFACIAPVALRESGEARAYTLAALLAAILLLCFTKLARAERTIPWLCGFAAAGVALVYVHYTGFLLLVLLALCAPYVFWRAGRPGSLVGLGAAYAAIALAYLPWMPNLYAHVTTGTPWANQLPRGAALDLINNNFGYLLPIYTRRGQMGLLLATGLLVAGIAMTIRVARGEPIRAPSGPLMALAFCAVGAAVAEVVLSQAEERYMFTFAPAVWVWVAAVCVWIARSTARLRSLRTRVAVTAGIAAALIVLSVGEVLSFLDARRLYTSSGIRTLAPHALSLGRERRTLFLAAPDYLGPTLGFYVGRPAGVDIAGFARWAHPELFTPSGYVDAWNAPDLLGATQRRIRAAAREGYVLLCLVRDADIRDRGKMRFTRSDELYAWLVTSLPHLSRVLYKGRRESVIVDLFALDGASRRP